MGLAKWECMCSWVGCCRRYLSALGDVLVVTLFRYLHAKTQSNPIRFTVRCEQSDRSLSDRFRNIPIDSEHRNALLYQPKPSGVLRASTRPPSPVRLKEREERAAATATESI